MPLFLNGAEIRSLGPSEKDLAALRYSHWISMMRRNPSGFRRDNTSKRKSAGNDQFGNRMMLPSPLAMFLNGLKLVARHGNDAPGSAFP